MIPMLRCLLPLISATLLASCASRHPLRDPTGEVFPSVVGNSLAGDKVRVPEDFLGKPLVLLVGYDQDAQFDADRWLVGLLQLELDVTIRELPTIPAFVPRLFSGMIDSGMRKGIPAEDWAAVVTVYGDGDKVAKFTGNARDNNMRAILLDADGRVRFFHDRGYSAGTLLRMAKTLEQMESR